MGLPHGDVQASASSQPVPYASCGEQDEENPSEGAGAGAAPGASPLSSLRWLRHRASVP